MADPVTMAVVGGTAGALLSPKDPLKGALLGAAGGYGGGALLGSLGATGTAAGTAAASGTAGAASMPGVASLTAGGTSLGGGVATSGLAAPAMTGLGLAPAGAGLSAGTASLAAPTMTGLGLMPAATTAGQGALAGTMAGLGTDMAMASKWMGQNPVLTEMAMGTGMQALQPKMPQTGSLIQGGGNQMQFTQMPTQPFMPNRKISLI